MFLVRRLLVLYAPKQKGTYLMRHISTKDLYDQAPYEMVQIAENMLETCVEHLRQCRDMTRNLSHCMADTNPEIAERLDQKSYQLDAKLRRSRAQLRE